MKRIVALASIIVLISFSNVLASSVEFEEVKYLSTDVYSLIGKTLKFEINAVKYGCKITGVAEVIKSRMRIVVLYISEVKVDSVNIKEIVYYSSNSAPYWVLFPTDGKTRQVTSETVYISK
jgi:hypothetical protein